MTIEQLGADDFHEAMDLLDLVFSKTYGPTDFAAMLPGLYQPTDERMRCLYAIRLDGKIRAMVGAIPIDWRPGGTALPMVGIGGVCTHPRFRAQGLVTTLLARASADMDAAGIPLSYLAGQRQRYAYAGYEVAGTATLLRMNAANLKHAFREPPAVDLRDPVEADAAELDQLLAWQRTLPLHCDRPAARFRDICRNWHSRMAVGRTPDGRSCGYLLSQNKGAVITELVGDSPDLLVDMVRVHMATMGGADVELHGSGMALETMRAIGRVAERVQVGPSGNWRVRDWPRVLSALMGLRARDAQLVDGAVDLTIDGAPLSLRVRGGAVEVQAGGQTGAQAGAADPAQGPALALDGAAATQLFFGPLRPSLLMDLPAAARVLDSWCPLPLALPKADTC